VNRKPKRLSFDTTYSHGNIYDWLKTILTDWTIIIPGSSCSEFAFINWSATEFTRNGVKQWLEEKNHQKSDDLESHPKHSGIMFQIISGTSKTVSGTQNVERNVPNTAHTNVPTNSVLLESLFLLVFPVWNVYIK
jgi:hypothetical protein